MAQKNTTATATGKLRQSPGADKLSTDALYKGLNATAKGLTSSDANQRLAQSGPNALEDKKESALAMFGQFFWGPMPWMIEAAAIMSLIVKDWLDFAFILVLLLFNAVLGFWHERSAANALDALKGQLAQEAQALRDGTWQTVPAATLVPGREGTTLKLAASLLGLADWRFHVAQYRAIRVVEVRRS